MLTPQGSAANRLETIDICPKFALAASPARIGLPGGASDGRYAAAGVGELARARIRAGAFAVEPVSNGGRGSYSIRSWIACAASSPAIRAASVSAMSMPDDTPADVTTLPCSTTRSSATGSAP